MEQFLLLDQCRVRLQFAGSAVAAALMPALAHLRTSQSGKPELSLFLRMPMAPEAGGLADTHQGGRQFATEDDPDWKNMKAWVMGQKAGASATP